MIVPVRILSMCQIDLFVLDRNTWYDITICKNLDYTNINIAQLAGAVEYSDCFSAEE